MIFVRRVGPLPASGTAPVRFRRRALRRSLLLAAAFAALAPAASQAAAGQVVGFGLNGSGQLGDGLTAVQGPAPRLAALPRPAAQLSVGGAHSLAVTTSGELFGFGSNHGGALGLPTLQDVPTPTLVPLPAGAGTVVQAVAGYTHSLVVTSGGQLFAFGQNDNGQLGNATNNGNARAANPTPVQVSLPGATGPVVQAAAGVGSSYAITSTGQLFSWGYGSLGQLGRAAPTNNPTPEQVTLPGARGPVVQIAASGYSLLALTVANELYSFGTNARGQLGRDTGARDTPSPGRVGIPGATGTISRLYASSSSCLVLTSTGQLFAFGSNFYGALGVATNAGTFTPNPTALLVPLPGRVVDAATASMHSLAITEDGTLFAFGTNRDGQLGTTINNGTDVPNPTPLKIDLPGGARAAHVASGANAEHSLVLLGADPAPPPPPPVDQPRPPVQPPGGGNQPPLAPAPPTVAQLAAALRPQLAPSGRAAKIGALLRRGSYTAQVGALAAGSATIAWYRVPRGARLPGAGAGGTPRARRGRRGRAAPRAELIARGSRTFAAAGTQSLTIRLTAAGRSRLSNAGRRLRLTALGTFKPAAGGPAATATAGFTLTR